MFIRASGFIVILMFVAMSNASGQDKCSSTVIGKQTENRILLSPRKYEAHTEEFIIEVTSAVCRTGTYAGAKIMACAYDDAPRLTPIDAHSARMRAGSLSDLSGQIRVDIAAYC